MKQLLIIITCIVVVTFSYSQVDVKKDIVAFKLTDYNVKMNDSTIIVQIQMPDGMSIEKNKLGVLRGNYSNGDTSEIGWGRCHLIKGDYYYFGIHLKNKLHIPKQGDLLYVTYDYTITYKGLLFNLLKHQIRLKKVTDEGFISDYEILSLDENKENALLDSLVTDIKYTGKVMLEQNNQQDQKIIGGRFDGKQLFATMQLITRQDVKDFLEFVNARPRNYAGNEWKISEIVATWMISKTPTVIKE